MYWNSINASKPKRKKLHEYFITVTIISDRYPVHYIQPPCTSCAAPAENRPAIQVRVSDHFRPHQKDLLAVVGLAPWSAEDGAVAAAAAAGSESSAFAAASWSPLCATNALFTLSYGKPISQRLVT